TLPSARPVGFFDAENPSPQKTSCPLPRPGHTRPLSWIYRKGGALMARPTAPDPAIGDWILNISKSNFALAPALKSGFMTVEAWEDGRRVKTDTIDAQENKIHYETAYKFDGRDYLLEGYRLADSISAKRINLRASESVWKKRGKVILT